MNPGLKKSFIETIDNQKKQYSRLKTIIETEASALNRGDMKGVEDAVSRQDEAVAGIMKLEEKKRGILADMAREAGLREPEKAVLSDIISNAGGKETAEIEKAVIGLMQAVKEVEVINSKNTHKLQNGMELVNFVKEAKEKYTKPVETTYNMKGEKKIHVQGAAPRIDQKI